MIRRATTEEDLAEAVIRAYVESVDYYGDIDEAALLRVLAAIREVRP